MHQPPQGDEKLARQGDDHGLAGSPCILCALVEPLRQSAILLMQQEAPGQLHHRATDTRIA